MDLGQGVRLTIPDLSFFFRNTSKPKAGRADIDMVTLIRLLPISLGIGNIVHSGRAVGRSVGRS